MSEISADQNDANGKLDEEYVASSSAPRLSIFSIPSTSHSPIIKSSVLKPSAFHLSSNQDKASDTSDKTNLNPFLLNTNDDDDGEGDDDNENKRTFGDEISSKIRNNHRRENSIKAKPSQIYIDPVSLLTNNGIPNSNLFSNVIKPKISQNNSFVFGQNLHERVAVDRIQQKSDSTNNSGLDESLHFNSALTSPTETSSSIPCSSTAKITSTLYNLSNNGNHNLLFSNASVGTITSNSLNNGEPKKTSIESLTEVARAYEESRAQKRKFQEVETFTGEEDEINVLEINSKLFAFVSSNWEERGPGNLRVNDCQNNNSRVVFRTSGNLRVLLNTKIWPGMVVEKPSTKSLRLTGIDSSGQIKIYLIMARPDDITNLYRELIKRLNIVIKLSKLASEAGSTKVKGNTSPNFNKTQNEMSSNITSVDEPRMKKGAKFDLSDDSHCF